MVDARILIVEDESIVAADIARRLERLGYEVPAVVHTGEQAIEVASRSHPDLVLMDVSLGGAMDGIETAQELAARFGIPVTFLTGLSDQATLERARQSSPYGYLVKPFDERELHATIQVALQRYHLEQQLEESRELLAAILSAVADGIIAADRDGLLRFMNPAAETITGWRLDEALGRPIDDVLRTRPQAAARGSVIEAQLLTKEGRLIPVEMSATQSHSPASATGELVWAFRDITARKQAEERLETSLQISQAIARVSRELIAALGTPALLPRLCQVASDVLGCDFSHTWVRQPESADYVAVAGHGHSREEWEEIRLIRIPEEWIDFPQDRDVWEVVPADLNRPQVRGAAEHYGVTRAFCLRLRRGAETVAMQTIGYRSRPAEFSPEQMRIAEGVARLSSLALEHQRLFEELERADRFKSSFMAVLSHELRTPLGRAIGYTELLLDGEFGGLTAEQLEPLHTVQDSLVQMAELVRNTLDFGRLEGSRVQLELRDVDLAELIGQLAEELVEIARRPGVQLLWEISPSLPRIRTDAVKLKVVIKNLVTNALKYTREGRVTVSAGAADGTVCLRVSDTGIGIPAESREDIFEPFRRLGGEDQSGIGLGLYIARQLIEMLGGRISVESELSRGSTFTIQLPLDRR